MVGEERDDTTPTGAAVAWHLCLPTASAEEWRAFTDWLEADPAHARAYDKLAMADAALDDALLPADWTPAVAANDPWPRGYARWAVAGVGSIAAAGVAAVMLPLVWAPSTDLRVIETPAGRPRAVVLADGTRIEMNGGTRLRIDDGTQRMVMLDRGEAVFRVTHDAAHPFVVQSGTMRLQDVGTVFNVARVGSHLGVQVAEGAVLFQPGHDRIMLTPGAALSQTDGGRPRMMGVAPGDVGSWRGRRLVFQQTPVHLVAAALERSTGAAIAVAPDLRDTPFTGSLGVAGGADRMVPRVAALIGARAVRDGTRWTWVRGDHVGP